jgi:hypothetical protein
MWSFIITFSFSNMPLGVVIAVDVVYFISSLSYLDEDVFFTLPYTPVEFNLIDCWRLLGQHFSAKLIPIPI